MNTTLDSLVHKKSGEDATQNENKINQQSQESSSMRLYAAEAFLIVKKNTPPAHWRSHS